MVQGFGTEHIAVLGEPGDILFAAEPEAADPRHVGPDGLDNLVHPTEVIVETARAPGRIELASVLRQVSSVKFSIFALTCNAVAIREAGRVEEQSIDVVFIQDLPQHGICHSLVSVGPVSARRVQQAPRPVAWLADRPGLSFSVFDKPFRALLVDAVVRLAEVHAGDEFQAVLMRRLHRLPPRRCQPPSSRGFRRRR